VAGIRFYVDEKVMSIEFGHSPSGVRHPEGCNAQAWSVAELLRVMTML
jgi:glycogen debranching enzyme